MIIITGATGKLGNLIIRRLAARIGVENVGATCRSPVKAQDLIDLGVRVRMGDFDKPDTLTHAFEGASQVLIVSSNARRYGSDPQVQHTAAIESAKAAGAQRVVYTSHMGASKTSKFPPMSDHSATEDILAKSGIAWTALRNGFYADSGVDLLGDFSTSYKVSAPEDGKVSWTSHGDLAEAAAIILSGAGQFEGPTPPLTNSNALDLSGIASIASEILGKEVTRHTVLDEAIKSGMEAKGLPKGAIATVMGLYQASRANEFATVDSTLERLIGRKPQTMKTVIEARLNNL